MSAAAHAASTKDRTLIACIGDEVRPNLRSVGGEGFLPLDLRRGTEADDPRWASSALHHTQDSITGLLLAGVGHVDKGKKNFLIVDASACSFSWSSTSRRISWLIRYLPCSSGLALCCPWTFPATRLAPPHRDAAGNDRGVVPRVHLERRHRDPPPQPACACPYLRSCPQPRRSRRFLHPARSLRLD